jgi:hypothetical protein
MHTQSRPIEGLSGRSFSREQQSHGLLVANLGHRDPDRDKGSHWTGHGDPRAMNVAHRALRDWSLSLLDAGAVTGAGLAGPRGRTRLGCYTFGGGMARIGLGVYDGQLSVVVGEVIDEPVALF